VIEGGIAAHPASQIRLPHQSERKGCDGRAEDVADDSDEGAGDEYRPEARSDVDA
jgi:hypothetical protein